MTPAVAFALGGDEAPAGYFVPRSWIFNFKAPVKVAHDAGVVFSMRTGMPFDPGTKLFFA